MRLRLAAKNLAIAWIVTAVSVVGAQDDVEEDALTAYDRDHWAYRPAVRPDLPVVQNTRWPRTAIDRFILARLEQESLQPAGPAERSTMIRRLCWDLLGLPPTPGQVQAFVADSRPDAYLRLVDSLLASPEYGIRRAQSWLDLARFAETDGYEHDKIRKNAWKYRDWVIAAMNADFPYNDFVRWQLAGDEIDPAGGDAIRATAFCLSGPDMPDINLQAERRHVLLNEITSTIGSVLMGLQFGCAQCHDHKYDAISQADFYRLRAFFAGSIRLEKNRSVDVLTSRTDTPPSHVMVRGDWRQTGPEVSAAFPRVLNETGQTPNRSVGLRKSLSDWLTSATHPLTARVIANRTWQHHFGHGLSATPSDFGVMGDSPTHPELLDYLAVELVQNGWSIKHLQRMILTSKVYRTRSTRPDAQSHQESWDRAEAADPENRWLSRFPRRRLSAEAIRDGLFAASDSLQREMGGAGVSPPLPSELIRTLKAGQWTTTSRQADHYRRSIYLFARRNLRYPFFATFDRPTADQPCARRERSTTAIQSLMLLNSDIMMDAADRLAICVSQQGPSAKDRIDQLYLRLYARHPTDDETRDAASFLSGGATLQDLCRAMLNSNEFLYVD